LGNRLQHDLASGGTNVVENDLFLESPNLVVANPNLVVGNRHLLVENPNLLVENRSLLVENRDLLVGNRNLLVGNHTCSMYSTATAKPVFFSAQKNVIACN
jgi:hypothetical protein